MIDWMRVHFIMVPEICYLSVYLLRPKGKIYVIPNINHSVVNALSYWQVMWCDYPAAGAIWETGVLKQCLGW